MRPKYGLALPHVDQTIWCRKPTLLRAVRRRRKRNRFWALFDSFGSPQVLALGEEGAHFGAEPVRCFDGTDMANARQDGES